MPNKVEKRTCVRLLAQQAKHKTTDNETKHKQTMKQCNENDTN